MPTDEELRSAILVLLLAPFLAGGLSVFGGLVTWVALRRAGLVVSFWSAYRTHFLVNALFFVVAGPLDLLMRSGDMPAEGAALVQFGLGVFYNLVLAVTLCRRYGPGFAQALRVVIETEVLAIRFVAVTLGLFAVYALGGLASAP